MPTCGLISALLRFSAALPGSEAYGEEHAWHMEGGVKGTAAGGKLSANAAVFFINWDDLQLNVPNQFVPGQFYIANVGAAHSRGVEFDLAARPRPELDLFAAVGFTSARFDDGTSANGVDVSDNQIPYTPDPWVWVYGIVGGGLLVCLAGWLATRSVVNQPPVLTLRNA